MQCITRHKSCLILVTTPAGYADNYQLAVIGSYRVANRTGSISHEIDSKAYDKATPSTEIL